MQISRFTAVVMALTGIGLILYGIVGAVRIMRSSHLPPIEKYHEKGLWTIDLPQPTGDVPDSPTRLDVLLSTAAEYPHVVTPNEAFILTIRCKVKDQLHYNGLLGDSKKEATDNEALNRPLHCRLALAGAAVEPKESISLNPGGQASWSVKPNGKGILRGIVIIEPPQIPGPEPFYSLRPLGPILDVNIPVEVKVKDLLFTADSAIRWCFTIVGSFLTYPAICGFIKFIKKARKLRRARKAEAPSIIIASR